MRELRFDGQLALAIGAGGGLDRAYAEILAALLCSPMTLATISKTSGPTNSRRSEQ